MISLSRGYFYRSFEGFIPPLVCSVAFGANRWGGAFSRSHARGRGAGGVGWHTCGAGRPPHPQTQPPPRPSRSALLARAPTAVVREGGAKRGGAARRGAAAMPRQPVAAYLEHAAGPRGLGAPRGCPERHELRARDVVCVGRPNFKLVAGKPEPMPNDELKVRRAASALAAAPQAAHADPRSARRRATCA